MIITDKSGALKSKKLDSGEENAESVIKLKFKNRNVRQTKQIYKVLAGTEET